MTGSEMISMFYVYYDRVASLTARGYEVSEVLQFLNNAQDQLIKDRVFGKNFQPPAIEDNEKRVADISPLLKYIEITTGISSSTSYGNSWIVSKSMTEAARIQYILRIDARITRTNPTVSAEYIRCDRIKTKNIGKFVSSAVNRTHFINPKFAEEMQGIYVIGDYYVSAMDRIKVNGILKPYPITEAIADYNNIYSADYMNLAPHTHQEIVDLAVQEALQVIGDQRWATKTQEQMIKTS